MSVERPRPLVAGNWKMNGLEALGEVSARDRGRLFARRFGHKVDLVVCPPATLIAPLRRAGAGLEDRRSAGRIATPRNRAPSRATSSAEMLADAGATYVIVGHSERRQYHGEKDADVSAKAGPPTGPG